MTAHPLCPLCRRVMLAQPPAARRPRVLVCIGNHMHELYGTVEVSTAPDGFTQHLTGGDWSGVLCPLCGFGMNRKPGGRWQCSAHRGHKFYDRAARRRGKRLHLACVRPVVPMGRNVLTDLAMPFWQSLVSRYGPVAYPPQSNFDGTMAMPGAVKHGGGSKSKRKGKKDKPKPVDRVQAWSEKYK